MRKIREEHHHTQEYVINNTGLRLWHYEAGRNFPTLQSIAEFCQFYNISLEEFFAGITYPKG